MSLNVHYHIRWSSSRLLDWQAFDTLKEAETAARELVRQNETFTLEAATVGCKRCLEAVEQAKKRQADFNRKTTKAHHA